MKVTAADLAVRRLPAAPRLVSGAVADLNLSDNPCVCYGVVISTPDTAASIELWADNIGAICDFAGSVAVAVGGTGYVVGDILTMTGGTGKVRVETVLAGVVTAVSLYATGGGYSSSGTKATTGGGNNDCTITIVAEPFAIIDAASVKSVTFGPWGVTCKHGLHAKSTDAGGLMRATILW